MTGRFLVVKLGQPQTHIHREIELSEFLYYLCDSTSVGPYLQARRLLGVLPPFSIEEGNVGVWI